MREERTGDERGKVTETLEVVQNQNTKSWKTSKPGEDSMQKCSEQQKKDASMIYNTVC